MPNTAVSTATSGANVIVNSVAGRSIRVDGYSLIAGGTVNVNWQDGAGNTQTGALPLVANSGISEPSGGVASVFTLLPGSSLVLNLGGSVQVSGHVHYSLV